MDGRTASQRAKAQAERLREAAAALIAVVESIDDARWRHVPLELPTRPSRARGQVLAETIERVLIGHYDTHRLEIEAKLR